MGQRSILLILIVTVCSLVVIAATAIDFGQAASDLCQAATPCPAGGQPVGNEPIWESLSKQFVISAHY